MICLTMLDCQPVTLGFMDLTSPGFPVHWEGIPLSATHVRSLLELDTMVTCTATALPMVTVMVPVPVACALNTPSESRTRGDE